MFELAKRLGLADQFHCGDPEAALAATLAPLRLAPEDLRAAPGGVTVSLETRYRKYREYGFATPSGRLAEAGQDPVPQAVPPGPAPDPGFPLLLTTAKWPQYCHSQQRHMPSLRRRMPEPLVELHPDTAATRGIAEGDWVRVETRVGIMGARARPDGHLDPGVVRAQYGWRQFPDGAGYANRLTDGACFDPVAGSKSLRHFPCEVRPAG